jgi:hypothetical protein
LAPGTLEYQKKRGSAATPHDKPKTRPTRTPLEANCGTPNENPCTT